MRSPLTRPCRMTSALTSMLSEQGAVAGEAIGDATGPEGMPEGRRVDGDDGLAEPALRLVGQPHHGEIGAGLDDGVDMGTIEVPEHVPKLLLAHVRDGGGGLAAQSGDAHDLEARLFEEALHLTVGHRLVGAEGRDAPDPVRLEGRPTGGGARGHAQARLGVDALDEGRIALDPAPEGLRRHAHDEIIWRAGHDVADGRPDGAADLTEYGLEGRVRVEYRVLDVHAPRVARHPGRRHPVEVV